MNLFGQRKINNLLDLRDKETPRENYWSFGYRGVYDYNRRVEI